MKILLVPCLAYWDIVMSKSLATSFLIKFCSKPFLAKYGADWFSIIPFFLGLVKCLCCRKEWNALSPTESMREKDVQTSVWNVGIHNGNWKSIPLSFIIVFGLFFRIGIRIKNSLV